jgi:hypothetical protein
MFNRPGSSEGASSVEETERGWYRVGIVVKMRLKRVGQFRILMKSTSGFFFNSLSERVDIHFQGPQPHTQLSQLPNDQKHV